jgi:hypothetical protein
MRRGAMNEPEYPKIEVLPADEGGKPKIKWTCREYIGAEIFAAPPGLTYEEVRSTANWPKGFKLEPIKEKDGLKAGDLIIVNGFTGLGVYKVEEMESGELMGRSGGMAAFLQFGTDDRGCWVCVGQGNLDSIMKLELYK